MTSLNRLFKKLSECTAEDVGIHNGVASVYAEIFRAIFKTESNRVYNCDGYWKLPSSLVGEDVYMLTEYKYGRNLKNKFELCKVLAQCVYYIHSFVNGGMTVPKVVVVGDENECVVVPSKVLIGALECGSDFSRSASSASSDERLMDSLMSNSYIDYAFVYDIDGDFDTEGFVRTVVSIAKANDEQVFVEINERNVEKVWRKFKKIVFGKSKTVNENEQVSVFVHYITDHNSFFRDPRKPKSFVFNGKEYGVVDAKQFAAFCNHFGYVRSVKQKEKLRATCDRFIEDTNRRMKGEFYTPTAFVDYAHDMISKEFGDDWKEKYVVWDCAWGTGNLTRDYKFKELYCSTLEQAELDIAAAINPEATKFQYDFLNDDFEKLPEGLQKAFKEKKSILFFINPPYGTGGTMCCEKMQGKNGLAKTATNAKMLEAGIGKASQNLYAQFLYRIMEMRKEWGVEVCICLFSPSLFLTGPAWESFRSTFFASFSYKDSIQFQASHFSNVTANWAIIFSLWRSGGCGQHNFFKTKCIEIDSDGDMVERGVKTLYNMDGLVGCSSWVKEPVKGLKGDDAPQFASALSLREDGDLRGKLVTSALGYFVSVGNNCNTNGTFNFLLSSCAAQGNGTSILSQNFDRVVANFAARKLIDCNWMNSKDEYMVPNVEDPRYGEYQNDSTVFSIFNTASNQSSLRQITYKDKLWDIKNEFFWMSREELLDLADNAGFEELYNDAKQSEERFVYKKLQTIKLSEEAQAVIDKASEILKKSFKYRQTIHENHPEYHLNAWDAGWYQIKKLCAELPMMKDDMEEFKTLFKRLSDKMRPMVYELGFLKK